MFIIQLYLWVCVNILIDKCKSKYLCVGVCACECVCAEVQKSVLLYVGVFRYTN